MQKSRYLFIFLFPFLMQAGFSQAAISFTNGKWESTFNCPEWMQGSGLSCDGLSTGGDWYCDDSRGVHRDQMTSSANYTGGAGGQGFRHWQGDGVDENGGGIMAYFPSPQKELWIRWYHRYESGFKWYALNYDKILYIWADGSSVVPEYKWTNDLLIAVQGGGSSPEGKNKGWQYVMNGDASDGRWHVHEVYLKMDTNQSNGIGRYWIDGELVINNTSVNYSGGESASQNGWLRALIGSNQRRPENGRCMAVDYDDIVIYNTTPPNRDSFGNPFIGPAGVGSSAPLKIQPPQGFQVK